MDNVPAAVQERAEAFAERYRTTDYAGRVSVRCCALCGTFRWGSSNTDGSGTVVYIEQMDCEVCRSVQMRAPEVFDWVLRVMTFRQAIAERDSKPPR